MSFLKKITKITASDSITIDLKKIADEMLAKGLKLEDLKAEEYDGWTDGLVDALEAVYELETKLSSIFKAM